MFGHKHFELIFNDVLEEKTLIQIAIPKRWATAS